MKPLTGFALLTAAIVAMMQEKITVGDYQCYSQEYWKNKKSSYTMLSWKKVRIPNSQPQT